MQVNVEVLKGLERKIVVKVPSEDIDKAVEKKLKSLKSSAKMPGFRPGKVPDHVVRKQYGESVRGEVIGQVLTSSYNDAIKKEALKPASMPKMNLLANKVGEPVEYEATFEVYPVIELKGLDTVDLEGYKVEVSEQDVDDMVENIRKQNTKWNEVDRASKETDRVELDFESLIDGKSFEGGSGKNVSLVLGSKAAIPGFEEGVIGAKADETLKLKLKFPDDYLHKGIAGKKATAEVKLHKVFEAELPELNDEFIKKLGVKDGNLEGFRKQVRESLEKEIDKMTKNQVKGQVLQKFVSLNPIDLPQALVAQEIEKLKQQSLQQFPKDKQPDPAKLPTASFQKAAVERVALALLFNEFVQNNGIKLDKKRVDDMVDEIAKSYGGDPKEVIKWYRSNKQQMQIVESTVLEEQVVEALVEQATVKEKTLSYKDFMAESQAKAKNQNQNQEVTS